jgi:putative ABC transport system permease protein
MTLLRRALLRLRAIVRRGTLENEMQSEMRLHLERATERYMARGMSLNDARLAARSEFGNRTALEEEGRDARGARWIDELGGDLRFAFRYFARRKATVAIIVAVLALGTGANTMIFSVYRAEFLRPPQGVPDIPAHAKFYSQVRATQTGTWESSLFTVGELAEFAGRRDIFGDLTGWAIDEVVVDGQAADSADARAVDAHFVTPSYFRTLGVTLPAGQGFVSSGDAPDMSVVMGYAMAERLYGSVAAAVGRRILVNETPMRIVGVAPERLEGAFKGDDAMLWIPLNARSEVLRVDRRLLEQVRSLSILGRLAPGATHEQASAFAQHVVTTTLPDSATRVGMARTATVQPLLAPPPGDDGQEFIIATIAISAVGGLILLVAWMNVSSLMVASAVARRHEVAVRLSLGASRVRVLRQLVTESTLLAIAGGVLGLTLGWWIVTLVAKTNGGGIQPVDVMPDGWTLLFVVALSVVTGIIFGLSPALHATRVGVSNALRDSGTATSSRSRLQRFFVGAQIALSQPLLLLLGVILAMVVGGFTPHAPEMSKHVIAVGLRPLSKTGAPSQSVQAVDALIPRLRALPEVEGAVQDVTGFDIRRFVVRDREGPAAQADTTPTTITLEGTAPGWFAMVEVPIMFGRDVEFADTIGAERNVIIGSDLAQRLWGSANPIGRRLGAPPLQGVNTDSVTLTVVGVYDATKALPAMTWGGASAGGDALPRAYTAHGSAWRRDRILVRTRGPGEAYLPELNRVLRAEIPSIPVTGVKTLEQVDREGFREVIQAAMLAGTGGFMALLLASLGLYGVVSLAVQQRTREIGIRIAIGARPGAVARMFLASGVRVSAIAMLVGLPLSVAGMKIGISQGMIVGGEVNVYLIGAAIAAILLVVAAAATWVPARRASRVDPASTLRAE